MAKQGPSNALGPGVEPQGVGEVLASQIHPVVARSGSPSVVYYSPLPGARVAPPGGAYAAAPATVAYAPPGAALGGVYAGQALQYAARDPQVQHAVRGALRDATHTVVKEVARKGLQQLVEVRTYVQENPSFLRALCFCVAAALLFISGLSLLSFWNILAKPFEYLFAVYDALFAAVIVVIEGKPEWFHCEAIQSQLFSRAAFLASQTGRAAFYLYVGTINLYKLPQNWMWKVIYIGMGGSLCAVGLLMLADHYLACCCRPAEREAPSSSSEDGNSE